VTFDAAPPSAEAPALDLSACEHMTVCDLTGVERFLVWAVRWCASQHDDDAFADLCLRDSFERAGLASCLAHFRRFVATAHGAPSPFPPASRLGCWRINALEAARSMLALGELADALGTMEARVRPWDAPRSAADRA